MTSISTKTLMIIGPILGLALVGFKISTAIKDYGAEQYAAGKQYCETAVKAKAKEGQSKLKSNQSAAASEAEKTKTIYVDVVREVAVTDTGLLAENIALRATLKTLKAENKNAPNDDSLCARADIPNDSLQIHTRIDNLLRGD